MEWRNGAMLEWDVRGAAAVQPTTGDAVVVTGVQRLVARPVPLPALGPRDLLIRTTLTAIAAPHAWPRRFATDFPLIPGDAAIGTVVAVGAAVDESWHDARVFVGIARTPDGINAARGVQQAWLVAPIDAAVRIDGLQPERALLIAPLGRALQNLDWAEVVAGARLAILGQGIGGQLVARVARLHGTAHIAVADTSACHLAHAVADQIMLLSPLSPIVSAVNIPSIDLLVDTTGDAALVSAWVARLRPGGILLLLGCYSRLDLAYLQGSPDGLRILLPAEPDGEAYAAARDLLSRNDFDTTGLTSHRFGVDRVAHAYAVALGDPDALQVVVVWE